MKAADVMVRDVITVQPDTSVQEIANLLLTHRISGVPVVDARGALVGIVSEGDLIRRTEAGTARRHSWWLDLFTATDTLAEEFVKANGLKANDIMSRRVVSAGPETDLGDIAGLLESNHIKRVPIVENGRLVGIVSRANLLQALATIGKQKPAVPAAEAGDRELREAVMTRLDAEPWSSRLITVTVHDGIVDLWGVVDSQSKKKAARVAVEVTPGVRQVNDNLVIEGAKWGV